MKELLFERQGTKQRKKTPKKREQKKSPKINYNVFRDIRKKFHLWNKNWMQYKKYHSKNKKKLLQFENVIAEIKNYIVNLEDKVVEITQKVEQKDWK